MIVTKKIHFHMGHRIPNHKSLCSNIHGHTYFVEVGVDDKVITTEGVSDEGMVIDFQDLKQVMEEEIDHRYDHNSIFYQHDKMRVGLELYIQPFQDKLIEFSPFIPTAENLAKHFYELVEPRLRERNIKTHHVIVWETPTSSAIYQI